MEINKHKRYAGKQKYKQLGAQLNYQSKWRKIRKYRDFTNTTKVSWANHYHVVNRSYEIPTKPPLDCNWFSTKCKLRMVPVMKGKNKIFTNEKIKFQSLLKNYAHNFF